MTNPMLGMPQGAEWLIILAVVILIFGAAKLPELARGTGQALRIFKAETKGLRDDDKDDDTPPSAAAPTELPPPPAATDTPTTQDRQPDTRNG
ncbi:MAG: Sec-independent protein translocase subunit TatA [Actinomycetota bacterium]|nr:Sec-independent protein translocase subunit TatA [Actinomycetota bacterium]